MSEALDRLADACGVEAGYHDITGRHHETSPETKRALVAAMGFTAGGEGECRDSLEQVAAQAGDGLGPVLVTRDAARIVARTRLPEQEVAWRLAHEDGETREGRAAVRDGRLELGFPPLPHGRARLHLEIDGGAEIDVIMAPPRCVTPADLGIERGFGITGQVYSIRDGRDVPSGDYTALAGLARRAGHAGADLLGINPVHAPFPAAHDRPSPYSPSNRAFLDWRLVDPAAAPGAEPGDPGAPPPGEALVDWPATIGWRLEALRRAHARFSDQPGHPCQDEFLTFRAAGGDALRQQCLFDALSQHFEGRAWWEWPEEYRSPSSAAVARFAGENARETSFFAYLQWVADRQLGHAHETGCHAGMRLGLYRDLAVGADPAGAASWATPELVVPEASVGAPPDDLAPGGQNWGLAPLSPVGLRATGYRPLSAAFAASMRHAGAVRIDHAMALQRLFWIPRGGSAADGAYVRYPFHDLLGVLALESVRARTVVIGEDLGTVPEGFREAMHDNGMLAYRVLPFERHHDGSFKSPGDYPVLAAACTATHDMPTVRGWLAGLDTAWRARVGQIPDEAAARRDREADIARLVDTLYGLGLIESTDPLDEVEFVAAVHRFVARTSSCLAFVQLEDLAKELEQPNLPGTLDEHPNWRRRLGRDLAEIFSDPATEAILADLRANRPRE